MYMYTSASLRYTQTSASGMYCTCILPPHYVQISTHRHLQQGCNSQCITTITGKKKTQISEYLHRQRQYFQLDFGLSFYVFFLSLFPISLTLLIYGQCLQEFSVCGVICSARLRNDQMANTSIWHFHTRGLIRGTLAWCYQNSTAVMPHVQDRYLSYI